MPLPLSFGRPRADPLPLGSYNEVTFVRADLIADGKALATHIEHRWHLSGVEERFSSVEVGAVVDVFFANGGERTKAFGPYSTFRLMDGVAYASGHVFAFFDLAQQDWYSLGLGRHWPTMRVMAAKQRTRDDARGNVLE